MRRSLLLVLLLLAAPLSSVPATASSSVDLSISMPQRFHLSHEEVYFSVVADNVSTGSLLRLEWTLHEGGPQTGTELQNGSVERTATGTSKSFGIAVQQFMTDSNWYTMTFSLLQDGVQVASGSKGFSVFTNSIDPSYSNMTIFGDSLSDIGNVKASIMNLPAVPPYWQGRFSNGPVWVEHVSDDLGITLSRGTGSAEGNNRAYGGSQTGQGYSYILLPNTGAQISNFLSNVRSSFSSSDLVIIWAGGNDFLYGSANGSLTHANIVSHIEAVIQAGAQNILVPNLPPLELTPEVRNRSSSEQSNIAQQINLHNSLLAQSIPILESQHGVEIIHVDAHSAMLQFMHNSTFLGLTNMVEMACDSSGSILPLPICNAGDPVASNVDEYVFFDKAHPTAAMHELIAIQAMIALGTPDRDDDGIVDSEDVCPWTNAGRIADENGCSQEQRDDDQDGVQNSLDDCPGTPSGQEVNENGCSESQRDSDGDGLNDAVDPCPYSQSSADHDLDGCDDDEDDDDDNDGVLDVDDNCPTGLLGWKSSEEVDIDGDGCRDIDEDSDDDGDGLTDQEEYERGTDQSDWDSDGDGVGDSEDVWPLDDSQWSDSDGDGFADQQDGTTPDSHPQDETQWSDEDGDGYGDNQGGLYPDRFPNDPSQWNDSDGDGFGDNLEGWLGDACPDVPGFSIVPPGCADFDLDGYADEVDAFPEDIHQWNDSDSDGYGDNPGFPESDMFPDDAEEWFDSDGDGYGDLVRDVFPQDSTEWNDTDGDGCGDNSDIFPEDPAECEDFDGDGVGDNADAFRRDPAEWADSDGDGVGDNADALPNDPRDWQDSDGDGIGDSMESSNSENFDILSSELILATAAILIVLLAAFLTRRGRGPKSLDPEQFWSPAHEEITE